MSSYLSSYLTHIVYLMVCTNIIITKDFLCSFMNVFKYCALIIRFNFYKSINP